MWVKYNDNPIGRETGDCVLRALSVATGYGWDATYWGLCLYGHKHADWGNHSSAWWDYLHEEGWKRRFLPNECPVCYTVRDFCREYPRGRYILGTFGHAVAVIDGDYIDTWDSGGERPIFYWTKEDYA